MGRPSSVFRPCRHTLLLSIGPERVPASVAPGVPPPPRAGGLAGFPMTLFVETQLVTAKSSTGPYNHHLYPVIIFHFPVQPPLHRITLHHCKHERQDGPDQAVPGPEAGDVSARPSSRMNKQPAANKRPLPAPASARRSRSSSRRTTRKTSWPPSSKPSPKAPMAPSSSSAATAATGTPRSCR